MCKIKCDTKKAVKINSAEKKHLCLFFLFACVFLFLKKKMTHIENLWLLPHFACVCVLCVVLCNQKKKGHFLFSIQRHRNTKKKKSKPTKLSVTKRNNFAAIFAKVLFEFLCNCFPNLKPFRIVWANVNALKVDVSYRCVMLMIVIVIVSILHK